MAWHLFYLTPQHLSAYAWKRRHLQPEGRFEATTEGLEAFSAYLEQRRHGRFRILANLRDESYQTDRIPCLSGRDRLAVVSRRLEQHFPGTPLAQATSLGYETDRRRNEILLLSALANPAEFGPWLERLAAAKAALASFHTLSQVSGQLLARLPGQPRRCLLLTRQDETLRASFIVHGQVRFSRLAPVGDASLLACCATEASRLHQYLVGQHLIEPQDSLPVRVLAHPLSMAQGPASGRLPSGLPYTLLDSHQAAASLGIATLPTDDCSEALFLHLLAARPPRQQLAKRELRQAYSLVRVRQALAGMAAASFLTALPLAGLGYHDSRAYLREARDLTAQAQELTERHQDIAGSLPQLPIDYESLGRITTRFADLERSRTHPGPMLKLVSRALDEAPGIELESIDWQLQATGGDRANSQEQLILQGSLRTLTDSAPGRSLAEFDGFVEALGKTPFLRTQVRRSPAEAGLRPDFPRAGGGMARAFTIEIIREAQP